MTKKGIYVPMHVKDRGPAFCVGYIWFCDVTDDGKITSMEIEGSSEKQTRISSSAFSTRTRLQPGVDGDGGWLIDPSLGKGSRYIGLPAAYRTWHEKWSWCWALTRYDTSARPT